MDATEDTALAITRHVLPQFDVPGATVRRLNAGLINETYLLRSPTDTLILQRVNPIFSPAIHENIAVVTQCLARAGLTTPRLVPTRDRSLCADLGSLGVWRLLTYVEGASFDVVGSLEQAEAAGNLVGRFHQALRGITHRFVGIRTGVHDTSSHLLRLRRATDEHRSHRLYPSVSPLAGEILSSAATLSELPRLEAQIGHGDLKFSNFIFAGKSAPERDRALCLVDLDTVGPISLAHELGDAWRSWCNRAGEDSTEAVIDLDVFGAAVRGYKRGIGRDFSASERAALLAGPEWVSLELAARFAADALCESYFGWDRTRFPAAGEHNLARARGQWALHCAFVGARSMRNEILRRPLSD